MKNKDLFKKPKTQNPKPKTQDLKRSLEFES
jgi:hypothetical protein